MPDLYTGSFNRVTFKYGEAGAAHHRFTVQLCRAGGGSLLSPVFYEGPDVGGAWDPADVTTINSLADYVSWVVKGLTLIWDTAVALHSVTSEIVGNDLNVVGLAPVHLAPVLGLAAGTGGTRSGVLGQYLLFQGYTQVGRLSKHMLAGISAKYGGYGASVLANTAAGAGTPENRLGDFLTRLQDPVLDGDAIRFIGITSQLDVDDEPVPLVAGYDTTFLHGQHKKWSKRFGY